MIRGRGEQQGGFARRHVDETVRDAAGSEGHATAGAERGGWTILRRSAEILDDEGLETDPDFRSAWIDGFVTIRLKVDPADPYSSFQNDALADHDLQPEVDELDPSEENPYSEAELIDDDENTPITDALTSPAGNQGVIEIPVAAPTDPPPSVMAPGDPVRRISSIASANRGSSVCC